MGSVRRRVEALERKAPHEFHDWPVEEQINEAVDKLFFYRRFHANDPVRYAATDREITMLGIAHAWEELQGDGEIRLPHSGTAIRFSGNGEDTHSINVEGVAVVEDLPEGVSGHLKRMNPEEQPARDQRLFEMWREESDRGEGRSNGPLRLHKAGWR